MCLPEGGGKRDDDNDSAGALKLAAADAAVLRFCGRLFPFLIRSFITRVATHQL